MTHNHDFNLKKRAVSGNIIDFTVLNHPEEFRQHQYLALDLNGIGSWLTDLSNMKYKRSLIHDQIFGYNELLHDWDVKKFYRHVHPDDLNQTRSLLDNALGGRGKLEFECRIIRTDNKIRWIWVKGKVISGKKKPGFAAGIISDITERKEKEHELLAMVEHKNILFSEIHHRVKNNLSIIVGVLFLQSQQTTNPDIRSLLTKSIHRIKSISLIHEKLYLTDRINDLEFGNYIRDLAAMVIDAYCVNKLKIDLDLQFDPIYMDINTALPCGLIINEMVTNACQHAFTSQNQGRISITLKKYADHKRIIVADNGKGMKINPDLNNPATLGMTLIGGLIRQLKADLIIRSEVDKGTEFQIRIYQ